MGIEIASSAFGLLAMTGAVIVPDCIKGLPRMAEFVIMIYYEIPVYNM